MAYTENNPNALTVLSIVRRVYERLRKPSQQALPYQTVVNAVLEVIARKKLDLALSPQNSLATTGAWFTPNAPDFPLQDEGFDGVLLPIRVEQRAIDSTYETGTNVPIVNYEVLDTSMVGGVSFYGEPLRMVFRSNLDYILTQQYRVIYESDFVADLGIDDTVGLPQFFSGMVVLETALKLLTVIEDTSPEFMAFVSMVSGRWEAEIQEEREAWKRYVRMFKGRAQVPIRTFWSSRQSCRQTKYFK